MKKLLPLLLLILIGCSEPDGPYKSYYDNGQIQIEGTMKDGEWDGPFKEYYENGQIMEEKTYKNGNRDGQYKEYSYNGNLKSEETFNNGSSTFKYYHDNGQLKQEGTYNNGNLDGPFKSYYENGQLRYEETYKNGNLDGPLKLYYENGQLESEGFKKDGKLDGLWKVYYENGELYHQQTYNNGEEVVSTNCSIVDDWVYPNYENATGAFKFMSNKSFNYSSTFFSITRYGIWKKVDECTYLLIYQNGDTQTVSISGDKYNDMFYIGETGYIRY